MAKRGSVEAMYERFDARYTADPNTGCWLWMGGYWENPTGYIQAQIWGNGKMRRAPRVSYERFVGPIPKGAFLCHRCNVSLCVNPAHLYVGDAKTNAQDAVRADRFVRGAKRPDAKLTDEKVRAIMADTRKIQDIARHYGMSWNAIGAIKAGITWAHVTGLRDTGARH